MSDPLEQLSGEDKLLLAMAKGSDNIEDDGGVQILNENFGVGHAKQVLVCTRGYTLNQIVDMTKETE